MAFNETLTCLQFIYSATMACILCLTDFWYLRHWGELLTLKCYVLYKTALNKHSCVYLDSALMDLCLMIGSNVASVDLSPGFPCNIFVPGGFISSAATRHSGYQLAHDREDQQFYTTLFRQERTFSYTSCNPC